MWVLFLDDGTAYTCIGCIVDVSELLSLPNFKATIPFTLASCHLVSPETRSTEMYIMKIEQII
jgi:hypothetical protein